ncbi:Methylthioribulose-1-phosphate dehydratase [Piedraia hortae CBS 480.64]|uniref:Methylthioribulose-1-phosphate dehydratase n=1 Tax=Piedraia hortae CBS 480.64 TaxID=1314780 RepID=A0A6A7BVK1_9PEZI|nr:Methylthioribulose-1-phosphate dehydratase [Piedraia hortae CBS 480.64]
MKEVIQSTDPNHPANLIPSLCKHFYTLGWVTGTGGGISIRHNEHVYLAPSGVQKEQIRSSDIFVLDWSSQNYIYSPPSLKPSACTPLFLTAYRLRDANCCIHTHSQWAVLVTLICEASNLTKFTIREIEQIKGISHGGIGGAEIKEGGRKSGNLSYFDTLSVPIIENTAREEDLTDAMEKAMREDTDACAVLVRRHGVYVWGKTVEQAKTQAESLDYLFELAVRMRQLGVGWT